jgi:hypothetical protein
MGRFAHIVNDIHDVSRSAPEQTIGLSEASIVSPRKRGYPSSMGAPSYDDETLSAYFQPVHAETWDDPIAGPVLRQLAHDAPEVILAVGDVDRSLIIDALAQAPEVRLARALAMAAFIERTRKAMGTG